MFFTEVYGYPTYGINANIHNILRLFIGKLFAYSHGFL